MRFVLLLMAELLKLVRSRVYLVTAALILVLAVSWPAYCAGLLALADHDMCASDALGWPGSLDQALGLVDGLAGVIMTLLGAWVVGSEFGRDTWKMTLPRVAARWPFVPAKAAAAVVGFLLMGTAAVAGWLLVAAFGGGLIGLGAAASDGAGSKVDVLAVVRDGSSRRSEGLLDAYAWSATPGSVRLESRALPLPEPAVLDLELGAGLHARVPLVVEADAEGTLPRGEAGTAGVPRGYSARDRSVRLAAVVEAAAALQAFHPWRERDPEDAGEHVAAAMGVAAMSPEPAAGVWRLLTPLRDGHARAVSPPDVGLRRLPWTWTVADEGLVITSVAPSASGGVRRGDRVVSWMGQPLEQAWSEWHAGTHGGTEGCRRLHAAGRALIGPSGQAVDLEVESVDGGLRTLGAAYATEAGGPGVPRLDAVTRLSDTTWYVDLERMDDRLWRATLPRLEEAESIIFDLRVYSGVTGGRFLRHLTDVPLGSDTFVMPVWAAPGVVEQSREARWNLTPLEPRLRARVAFLVSPRSVSYAETLLGIIERYELGVTVGETSCGTNGNRALMRLLDGTRVTFTGLDTLGPDGLSRNRVGFVPGHPVSPTQQGILDGRDEVLEAALGILSSGGG